MAMYVVFKSKNAMGKQNSAELHIPFGCLPEFEGEEIDYIQADCDELDEILSRFQSQDGTPTIPIAEGRNVMRWYGCLAKCIYYNL
jgi:hypothetical protein